MHSLWMLAAGLSFALMGVFVKFASSEFSAAELVFYRSAVAYWNVRQLVRSDEPEGRVVFYFGLFGFLGSLVWMAPQEWHPIALDNVGLLAGVGVLGSLGQLAMTRAYGKGSTLVSAALSYSGIVFASVFGILIWDDVLPAIAWLGIALIILAGIIAIRLQSGAPKDAAPQITND
ncbi:MAG: EamA family transporter [Betaproteobacteria bacterium]|nr:EamA family transporter [Betaproteobacteria bacterium]